MRSFALFALLTLALLIGSANAQPVNVDFGPNWTPEQEDQKRADDLATKRRVYRAKVAFVEIDGLWAKDIRLPIDVGDVITPDSISTCMRTLMAALASQRPSDVDPTGFLRVEVDYIPIQRQADRYGVIFHSYYLQHRAPQLVSLDFTPEGKEKPEDIEKEQKQAHQRARRKNAYYLRAGSVVVEGRYAGTLQLPLAKGDLLTPENISASMNALRQSITSNSFSGFAFQTKGEVGVLYIHVEFTNTPASDNLRDRTNEVDVIFHPLYLHLSLVKIGNNVLPVPRSELPTFYNNVPKSLLRFQPTFGASYDRSFGTALDAGIATDLLNFSDPAHPANINSNRQFTLEALGSKSMNELFYRAAVGLDYRQTYENSTLREIGATANYDGNRAPLGDGENRKDSFGGGFGTGLKLAPVTRLWADVGYRYRSDDTRYPDATLNTSTKANEQFNRLLFEAIPPGIRGFVRATAWEDNGWVSGTSASYQRLIGRVGYEKEVPLAQNQTLGLELIAGAGKLWGEAPDYARFFGGNSSGQFLYDGPNSPSLRNMPAGPLIRSFGQAEAGFHTPGAVRGGDAFWHVNLNLAIPIPLKHFSVPLFPNEETGMVNSDGDPVTIKDVMNRQLDVTGPSMLAAALQAQNPGLSEKQAMAQAQRTLEEVTPAASYVINDANFYSIKPMLMFDAAGLSGGPGGDATWLAGGAGVQLTVVVAKFELGYMHTLSGPTFGSRGNVFFRLVFENLF